MTDKLGQVVKQSDLIAIAEMKVDDNFIRSSSTLRFATIILVKKDCLHIRYNDGYTDDCFISKEFVVIKQHKTYKELEGVGHQLIGLLGHV